MNNEIQFILERYRSGGSNRFTCPHCGGKKSFTRYVNTETGEYVADECGKCNHESSCGYHYPPREYFRDHPEVNQLKPWERPIGYDNRAILAPPKALAGCTNPVNTQTEFFDMAWAEKACDRNSTFRTWFEGLAVTEEGNGLFAAERISEVLAEYYVGGTEKDVIAGGVNYGPAAVFWLIDEKQRVHDAKFIAYKTEGRRVAEWGNTMRSICERTKKGPQLQETEKVLFGLHLLPRYPDKVVCIVESEKSALICACRYPQYVWLATGGCGNLQASKLQPLMHRRVVVYPDSGEYHKWSERMKESGHRQYRVVYLLEDYEPNTDIADIILGVAKEKEVEPF